MKGGWIVATYTQDIHLSTIPRVAVNLMTKPSYISCVYTYRVNRLLTHSILPSNSLYANHRQGSLNLNTDQLQIHFSLSQPNIKKQLTLTQHKTCDTLTLEHSSIALKTSTSIHSGPLTHYSARH